MHLELQQHRGSKNGADEDNLGFLSLSRTKTNTTMFKPGALCV
jgi:hypothetical protein